jgi:hypothetical protein
MLCSICQATEEPFKTECFDCKTVTHFDKRAQNTNLRKCCVTQAFLFDVQIFPAFAIIGDKVPSAKPREVQILAHFLPASIFLITNILVSEVTVFLVLFAPFFKRGLFFMDVMGGKITISLKELH